MRTLSTIKKIASPIKFAVAGLFVSTSAFSANYGTDLNNTMLPAAGGVAGVSIAHSIEPAAAVFGNPATLTQYNEGTKFSFGATFYKPDVKASHNGGNTGVPWSGKSKATNYLVPTIAVTQAFSDKMVAGLGLTVQSGIGSDFRDKPGSLNPDSELLVFTANVGLGYKLTDNLSLGGAVTIGNGYLQMGLSSNTASSHGFGVRGTFGAKYDVTDSTSLGAYYRSPLKIKYDNVVDNGVAIAPGKGNFWDVNVEQPQEFAIGISNNSLLDGNLRIGADVIYKDWSSADLYKDIFRDQTIFALGGELKTGAAKWRLGYTHARDPIKRNVGSSIAGVTSMGSPVGTLTLNPSLVQYFQATNAEPIWEDQVTAGFGYALTESLALDTHVAFALKNRETIGFTSVSASTWQAGLGLTWSFK
ncbi:outer membrane protein transport protein [Methylophilus sp. 13]|uniref:OmpP1/FadL family transporter n=1 Tax=Methylophilus sp. 13 TaxID=2781018 RepID=UPI00188EA3B7|nr:outer membrane protein transport protein [Methylophilus sp. 13]MBF5037905.1 outer membrane protein transport protein [Methylophilus sp. 13]